jgi:tetratricopeptide (TPR) repeat protein
MLNWLLAHDPSRALTLSSNLYQVRVGWISPGEAREWLEAAMGKAQPTDSGDFPMEYGAAQIGLGMQLHNQGDYPGSAAVIRDGLARVRRYDSPLWVARGLNAGVLANIAETQQESAQMVEEAIRISREHDFRIELAVALGIAAFARIMAGDLESSRPYAEEVIALAREYGNLWLTAGLLRLRGNMLRPTDARGEAAESYLEALDKMEAIGDRHTVNAIRSDLADLYRLAGDFEEAERLYRQTILGWQEEGHQPVLAHQLECFAYIAIAEENYPRGAKLIGASQAVRAGISHESRLPPEITEFEEAVGELNKRMGEAEARIEMGSRMSLDEAVAYARGGD